jgi:hypothetical protein
MKKGMIFMGLAVVLALFVFAPHAGAQMTSPYLAGEWEITRVLYDQFGPTDWQSRDIPIQTQFKVINPTTASLDVYVVLLDRDGNQGDYCYWRNVPANGTWKSCWPYIDTDLITPTQVFPADDHHFGAAKFFAFPANTKKFDANAVIAGFQQKSAYGQIEGYPQTASMETPLYAVTINSKTIGEFTKYDLTKCLRWNRYDWACAVNQGPNPE